MVGARSIPLHDLWPALGQPSADPFVAEVIRSRVPRTVLGLVSGAALALSGALMQALTRNPLADPGILGINSGAALAVLVGIAHLGLTAPIQYVWLAIVGAASAAALVWLIGAGNRSRPTPVRLALAGAIVTAVLTGFIQMVLLPRPDLLQSFRTWQAGSLSGPDLGQIAAVSPLFLVGVVLAAISAPGLNILALGEDLAAGLGTRVAVVRVTSSAAAVLLAAGTTALTGPIGFVGLIVPHAVRAVGRCCPTPRSPTSSSLTPCGPLSARTIGGCWHGVPSADPFWCWRPTSWDASSLDLPTSQWGSSPQSSELRCSSP